MRVVAMRYEGDCARAAIATVYGLRYGDTPRYRDPGSGEDFYRIWARWAERRGQQLTVALNPARQARWHRPYPDDDPFWASLDTRCRALTSADIAYPYVAIVPGPNCRRVGADCHAVVMKERSILHDPDMSYRGRQRIAWKNVCGAMLLEDR